MAFPTARQSHRRRDGESELKGYRVAAISATPRLRIYNLSWQLSTYMAMGKDQPGIEKILKVETQKNHKRPNEDFHT